MSNESAEIVEPTQTAKNPFPNSHTLSAIVFGWQLPFLQNEARKIIAAMQMNGKSAAKASFQQPASVRDKVKSEEI